MLMTPQQQQTTTTTSANMTDVNDDVFGLFLLFHFRNGCLYLVCTNQPNETQRTTNNNDDADDLGAARFDDRGVSTRRRPSSSRAQQ
jgi:hypothetical protein